MLDKPFVLLTEKIKRSSLNVDKMIITLIIILKIEITVEKSIPSNVPASYLKDF